MSDLVPNLPDLQYELSERPDALSLCRSFEFQTLEDARSRLLAVIALWESEAADGGGPR